MEIEKLNQLREEIDAVDTQLLKLFEQRMEIVENIALFKKEHDLPILNSSREEAILEKISNEIKSEVFLPYAKEYFKNLMELSRAYQKECLSVCDEESLNKHIILIGMPGSGKTTIGKLLSEQTDTDFVDVDIYIEEKNSLSIEKLFEKGEAHFRELESEALDEVLKLSPRIISTGGGIVTREENINLLKSYGTIIYIDRDIEDILKDINVSHRPLLSSGKEKLAKLYKERKELYETACDYRIVNNKSVQHVIDRIIEFVKNV